MPRRMIKKHLTDNTAAHPRPFPRDGGRENSSAGAPGWKVKSLYRDESSPTRKAD